MGRASFKRLQVFVSSTYEDLKDLRRDVILALREAGHFPITMEDFGAQRVDTMLASLAELDDADVVVVLIGNRYGSIHGESTVSYTHREFREAMARGKPVLAFTRDPARDLDEPGREHLAAFRKEVASQVTLPAEPVSDDRLPTQVVSAVSRLSHDLVVGDASRRVARNRWKATCAALGLTTIAVALARPWQQKEPPPVPPVPRVVRLVAPADGAQTRDGSVAVVGRVEPAGDGAVMVGSRRVVLDDGAFSVTVPLSPGRNEIPVHVDGATEGVTLTVVRDDDPPQVRIVSSTPPLIAQRVLPLQFEVRDAAPGAIDTVWFSCNGGDPEVVGPSVQRDLALHEGANTFVVRATDRAGNETTCTKTVELDSTPPEWGADVPGLLTVCDSSATLLWRVVDLHPDRISTGRLEFPVDADGSFRLPITELPVGTTRVVMWAIDAVGNRGEQMQVEIRRLPPPTAKADPASTRWHSDHVAVGLVADREFERITVLAPDGSTAELAADHLRCVCRVPCAIDVDQVMLRVALEDATGCKSEIEVGPVERPGRDRVARAFRVLRRDDGGRPDRILHLRTGIELVLVPACPQRGVPEEFWIGRTEVTEAQFLGGAGSNLPKRSVAADQALNFCTASIELKLPTVEQWQVAASSPAADAADPFAWGVSLWAVPGFVGEVRPVGQLAADTSACGAMDMVGNVEEWCLPTSGDEPVCGGHSKMPKAQAWARPRVQAFVGKSTDVRGFRVAYNRQ